MSNRKRKIIDLVVGEGEDVLHRPVRKVIEIDISYTLGGQNYFTGRVDPRGYFMHVRPVDVGEGGFRSFMLFSGYKMLVKEASRYSDKGLYSARPDYADVIKLLDATLRDAQLELPDTEYDRLLDVYTEMFGEVE